MLTRKNSFGAERHGKTFSFFAKGKRKFCVLKGEAEG